MRILLDPEIFHFGPCGMTRYYAALYQGLSELGHKIDLPLRISGSEYLNGHWETLHCRTRQQTLPWRLLFKLSRTLDAKDYLQKVNASDYDLLLLSSPVQNTAFLKPLGRRPFAMVVHDTMRITVMPDGAVDTPGMIVERLSYLARRASMVICISESTRSDLLQLSGMNPDRAVTIHTGQLLDSSPCSAPSMALPDKYVLFVGERSGRKNFRFLLQALAPLFHQDSDLHLICTGTINEWESDWLNFLGISRQVISIPAPDPVLRYLYRHALCLAHPTYYEGYGLPVLEAMALGCPVVSANNSSIPEIGGDAVLYVNATDADSILNSVAKLNADPELRRRLSETGVLQAAKFTREKMMKEISRTLKDAIKDVNGLRPSAAMNDRM
jgi:glycosyltransferase involved in cell wall biosynthesis